MLYLYLRHHICGLFEERNHFLRTISILREKLELILILMLMLFPASVGRGSKRRRRERRKEARQNSMTLLAIKECLEEEGDSLSTMRLLP